ncbi:ecto-ADP-ribosyltransferase 5-like [Rhinophrynus dorsalis]
MGSEIMTQTWRILGLIHAAFLVQMRLPQVKCQAKLLLHPDTFDDQYIGCPDELDYAIMPNLLLEEKSLNPQFSAAWDKVVEKWKALYSIQNYTDGEDPYEIAFMMFAVEDPGWSHISQEFNDQVRQAGVSRDYYMKEFHYKALHYYLTKYLLDVQKKCPEKPHKVFIGDYTLFNYSNVFRFGKFATIKRKNNQNITILMTSCFGVQIRKFYIKNKTVHKILIPVYETFFYIGNYKGLHHIQSTGLKCSHFNCAYLGGEKQQVPICRSGDNQMIPISSASRFPLPFLSNWILPIFSSLILIINTGFPKMFCTLNIQELCS